MSTCCLTLLVMNCAVLLTPQLQNASTNGSKKGLSSKRSMANVHSVAPHRELKTGMPLSATVVTDDKETGSDDWKVQLNESRIWRVDLTIDERTANMSNGQDRIKLKAGKWQSQIGCDLTK